MTFPRVRLTVSAILFVAWLLYLLSLVIVSRHTIVLSRPQFLVADLTAIAEVSDDNGKPSPKVKVHPFASRDPDDEKLDGQTIAIANLPDAAEQGYAGPGSYILPLRKRLTKDGLRFEIVPVPSSPGYLANFWSVRVFRKPGAEVGAERVARLASVRLGVNDKEAYDAIKDIAPNGVLLAHAVSREQAEQFVKAVKDDAKCGVDVDLSPYDVRIYPLTPETKEQLDEMIKARQQAP
jgi:hypothetical protein